MDGDSQHSSADDGMGYYDEQDDQEQVLVESISQSDQLEAKSRGRKPIQDKWMEFLSLSSDNFTKPPIKVLATSLIMAGYLPKAQVQATSLGDDEELQPRFHHKDFIAANPEPTVDAHRLSVDQLKQYGIIVTSIRKQLEDAAEVQVRAEMAFKQQ